MEAAIAITPCSPSRITVGMLPPMTGAMLIRATRHQPKTSAPFQVLTSQPGTIVELRAVIVLDPRRAVALIAFLLVCSQLVGCATSRTRGRSGRQLRRRYDDPESRRDGRGLRRARARRLPEVTGGRHAQGARSVEEARGGERPHRSDQRCSRSPRVQAARQNARAAPDRPHRRGQIRSRGRSTTTRC